MVPALTPLALKQVPVTLTLEMITFVFPLFVRATLSELVVPSFTFPKLKMVGFAPSSTLAATQVPLDAISVGELGALLANEMLPLAPPAEDGVKLAESVTLWPKLSVVGEDNPTMAKPEPEIVAEEIVMLAAPEFVRSFFGAARESAGEVWRLLSCSFRIQP